MRASDLASVGAFAQGPAIRRDMAKVVSHIQSAAAKGSDVSGHIAAVREFLKSVQAGLVEVEKTHPKEKSDAS